MPINKSKIITWVIWILTTVVLMAFAVLFFKDELKYAMYFPVLVCGYVAWILVFGLERVIKGQTSTKTMMGFCVSWLIVAVVIYLMIVSNFQVRPEKIEPVVVLMSAVFAVIILHQLKLMTDRALKKVKKRIDRGGY